MNDLSHNGFSMVAGVLDEGARAHLVDRLGEVGRAGRRGLLGDPDVATLAQSATLLDLVRPHLPSEPVPARAIYFDKTPGTNWLVPWHQDLTIAVRHRKEVEGFGPWSTKEGVPHVQPPVELLERMLVVRLHLDAADEDNGALRVLPGTHRFGRLPHGRIQDLRREVGEVVCRAEPGDAMLMRPLLLHASRRSDSPGHRRVLHIEYAGYDLPPGLEWAEPGC